MRMGHGLKVNGPMESLLIKLLLDIQTSPSIRDKYIKVDHMEEVSYYLQKDTHMLESFVMENFMVRVSFIIKILRS